MEQKEDTLVTFNIFPSEMTEEILWRLDVKSLMKVKCVCKSWFSLISNPRFMNDHIKHQVPRVLLLHDDPINYSRDIFTVLNLENFDDIETHIFPLKHQVLVGSQNGVICLLDSSDYNVHLWNPAIKVIKTLPPTPLQWIRPTRYLHGFGYEPSTNDFKVVRFRIVYGDQRGRFYFTRDQVGVYSLRNNSWKYVERPDMFSDLITTTTTTHQSCSLVVNTSIHWLVYFKTRALSIGILAFDLRSTGVFKLINIPIEGRHVEKLWKVSDCLAFNIFEQPRLVIEIWIMKKYGVSDSWMKYLSVDLTKHISFWKGWPCQLGFWNNGNLVLDSNSTFFSYDLKSHRLKCLSSKMDVAEYSTHVESIFLS